MQTAQRNGDQALFERTFRSEYGVAFNADNVNTYAQNPTQENYTRAFGDKDIEKRVSTFCTQQDKGAANVKTGAVAGGAALGAAAVIATGGAAAPLVIGAGSTAAGLTGVAVTVSDKNSNGKTSAENYTAGEVAGLAIDTAASCFMPNLPGANGVVSSLLNEQAKNIVSGAVSSGGQQVAGGIQNAVNNQQQGVPNNGVHMAESQTHRDDIAG
jgi:hypothetical protein